MKRLFLLLFCFLLIPAEAVTVSVRGETIPQEPGPLISQGRVLLPLRQVFQSLDAQVDYRQQTIYASRGNNQIKLRPFETRAEVNGQTVLLDEPARIVDGRTYVPLRFVAQALGETVRWESSSKTVFIGQATAQSSNVARPKLASSLRQLVVGNQGGVLKVRSADGNQVLYYRGLDDRSTAPLTAQDQNEILRHLGLNTGLAASVDQVLASYRTLPQKESLAFLGVVNSISSDSLPGSVGRKVRKFLTDVALKDPSVHNRRQALLSLAVGSAVESDIAESVVEFYAGSENLWETFPVQQFFEYQAPRLKQLPNFEELKSGALAVNSLYREPITEYLGE